MLCKILVSVSFFARKWFLSLDTISNANLINLNMRHARGD